MDSRNFSIHIFFKRRTGMWMWMWKMTILSYDWSCLIGQCMQLVYGYGQCGNMHELTATCLFARTISNASKWLIFFFFFLAFQCIWNSPIPCTNYILEDTTSVLSPENFMLLASSLQTNSSCLDKQAICFKMKRKRKSLRAKPFRPLFLCLRIKMINFEPRCP